MPKQKLKRTLLVLLPIIAISGAAGWTPIGKNLALMGCCGREIDHEESPDHLFVADVIDYSCAAINDFNVQIFVHRKNSSAGAPPWLWRSEPIFSCLAGSPATVLWQDARTLTINSNGNVQDVSKRQDFVFGEVKLRYSPEIEAYWARQAAGSPADKPAQK